MEYEDRVRASTCLSYVKELGVTHVEFLPWHDFAGVDELGTNKNITGVTILFILMPRKEVIPSTRKILMRGLSSSRR